MTQGATRYEPIALSAESTVVAEYVPEPSAATYQSEAALEAELIRLLVEQAYEYLPLTTEAELVANLRAQLEDAIQDYNGSSAPATTRRPTGSRPTTKISPCALTRRFHGLVAG